MDDDDFYGATQAMLLSDSDNETDDDAEHDDQTNKLRATLCVLKQKTYPETEFPVYEGTNTIGRGEGTNIHIPLKALSKEHACIEVTAGTHIVYDKGSLNKTRRRKLVLTPEVRYELQDGDNLIFGNVQCVYRFAPPPQAENINNNARLASAVVVVPNSESDEETSGNRTHETSVDTMVLVLDESDLTLGTDTPTTSKAPTIAAQKGREPGDGDMMQTQAYFLEPEKEAQRSAVKPASSTKTQIYDVDKTVAYEMDVEDEALDVDEATHKTTKSPTKNAEDTKEIPPILNLGVSSTLAFDDALTDDTDSELSVSRAVLRQETTGFKAGGNTDAAQDYDMPTQVFPEEAGEAPDLEEDSTQVLEEGPVSKVGEGDRKMQVLEGEETLALEVEETKVPEDEETQVLEGETTQVLDGEETQVLMDEETQVLEVKETQVLGEVTNNEATQELFDELNTPTKQAVHCSSDEATQVFVDTMQVHSDDEAATQNFTDPSSSGRELNARNMEDVDEKTSTIVIKNTPSPKKKVMWATQVFSDDDATDDEILRASTSFETHGELGIRTGKALPKSLADTELLEDDCGATQVLDDLHDTIEVDQSPIKKTTKLDPQSTAISPLAATQDFVCEEPTTDSDEDVTIFLDDTCPSREIDNTPFRKPAKKAPRASDSFAATQGYSDDCEATQMIEETPFRKPTKKPTRVSGILAATQLYDDECDATQMLDETPTIEIETFDTPVQKATRGFNPEASTPIDDKCDATQLVNKTPTVEVDTSFHKPANKATLVSKLFTSTHMGNDECDAVQILDETPTVEVETPFRQLTKKATRASDASNMDNSEYDATLMMDDTPKVEKTPALKITKKGTGEPNMIPALQLFTADATVIKEIQPCMEKVGISVSETPVPRVENFVHPDEIATQAYAMGSDIDEDESGNESEEIDFGTPMPILPPPDKPRKWVKKTEDVPKATMLTEPTPGISDTAEMQTYCIEDTEEASDIVGRAGDEEPTQAYALHEDVEEDDEDVEADDEDQLHDNLLAVTSVNLTAKTEALPMTSPGALASPDPADDSLMLLEENTSSPSPANRKRGRQKGGVRNDEQKLQTQDEVTPSDQALPSSSANSKRGHPKKAANATKEKPANASEEPSGKPPPLPTRVMARHPRKSASIYGNDDQRRRASSMSDDSLKNTNRKRKQQEVKEEQPTKRRQVEPSVTKQVQLKDKQVNEKDVQVEEVERVKMAKTDFAGSDTQEGEMRKEDDGNDTVNEIKVENEKEVGVPPPRGMGRRSIKLQPTSIPGHGLKAKEKPKEEPTVKISKKCGVDKKQGDAAATDASAAALTVGKEATKIEISRKHNAKAKISKSEHDESESEDVTKEDPGQQVSRCTRRKQTSYMPVKESKEPSVELNKGGKKTVWGRGRSRKVVTELDDNAVLVSSETSEELEVDGAHRSRSRSKDSKAESLDMKVTTSKRTKGSRKSCVGEASQSSVFSIRATRDHLREAAISNTAIAAASTTSVPPAATRTTRSYSPKEADLLTKVTRPVQRKHEEEKAVIEWKDNDSTISTASTRLKGKQHIMTEQTVFSVSVERKNKNTRNTRGKHHVISSGEEVEEKEFKSSSELHKDPGHSPETGEDQAVIKEVTENPKAKGRKGRGSSSIVKSEPSTETASAASEGVSSKPRRGGRGKAFPVILDSAAETTSLAETALVASEDEDVPSKPRRGGRGKALPIIKIESAADTSLAEPALVTSGDVSSKPRRGGRGKALPIILESAAGTSLAKTTTLVPSEDEDVPSKPWRGGRGKNLSVKSEPTNETASKTEAALVASKDVSNKAQRRSKENHLSIKSESAKEAVLVEESGAVDAKDGINKPRRHNRGKHFPVKSEPTKETIIKAETFSAITEDVSKSQRRGGRGKSLLAKLEPAIEEAPVASNVDLSLSTRGKRTVTTLRKNRSLSSNKPVANTSTNVKVESESESQMDTVQSSGRRSMKRRSSTDNQASNVSSQLEVKRGRRMTKRSQSQPKPPDSPGLQQHTEKPKVMFTGVIDDKGQKIIKDLGGELADNIFECSHLVTDKVRRTVKFLCGIARGLPIVNTTWLEACHKAHSFVDVASHLVSDAEAEKTHNFKLTASIDKAAKHPMLHGYSVHVTKSVKPDPSQMEEIIKSAGGEFLTSMPVTAAEQTLVVSCDVDKGFLKGALSAGIPIVSAEFLLTGILRQEVDLHTHQLFPPGKLTTRNRRK